MPASTILASSEEFLNWALTYSYMGWPVLPVHFMKPGQGYSRHCTCGDFHCKNEGMHTYIPLSEASTDALTIQDWWQQYPQAGVGITTGVKSGLVVLYHDKFTYREAIQLLEDEKRYLINIAPYDSGISFDRYYFQHPGGIVQSRKVDDGLILYGDGDWIPVYPTFDENCAKIKWGRLNKITEITPPLLPEWLLDTGPIIRTKATAAESEVQKHSRKLGQKNIILSFLKDNPGFKSPADISKGTAIKIDSIKKNLKMLVNSGHVDKFGHGQYCLHGHEGNIEMKKSVSKETSPLPITKKYMTPELNELIEAVKENTASLKKFIELMQENNND